jgi:hypothetical protein
MYTRWRIARPDRYEYTRIEDTPYHTSIHSTLVDTSQGKILLKTHISFSKRMKLSFSLAILIQGALGFQAPLQLGNPTARTRSRLSLSSPFSVVSPTPMKSCSTQQRIWFPLNMAEEPIDVDDEKNEVEESVEENASEAKVSPEKLKGRKKRVIGGYKILVGAYGLFGAVMLGLTRTPFYSSGPLLASGISYIMIGAAENSRLSSDTYKRLNIALFEYGLVGFVAGVCMKLNILWKIACFIAIVNSIKGYGYGLKGWELGEGSAKEDLISGMKSNVKSMLKIPNIKSAGYSAATLTFVYLKFAKLAEVVKLLKTGGTYVVGTRLFSLSRLMIFTIAMFTLKDAADRDRLEGTTFVELNAMTSVSLATWAAYEKLSTPFGKLFAFFSIFSAFNGVSSVMKKNKK